MSLRVPNVAMLILSIIPVAIVALLWVGADPADGYTFEGSVHENNSLWFDVNVSEPADTIEVHFSTTDYDGRVAMILYDPDGYFLTRNDTYEESLWFSKNHTMIILQDLGLIRMFLDGPM